MATSVLPIQSVRLQVPIALDDDAPGLLTHPPGRAPGSAVFPGAPGNTE